MGRGITERTLKQRRSIVTFLESKKNLACPSASRGEIWQKARGLSHENGMRLTNLLAGLVRDGLVIRTGARKTAVYSIAMEAEPYTASDTDDTDKPTADVLATPLVAVTWEDSIATIVERINAMVDVNNLLGDKILELEAAITAFLNGTSTMADLSAVIE